MSEQVRNWYVLKVMSGKEKKVKGYIENEIKRIGYTDYVHQILIPTERVYQIRKKTTKDGKETSKIAKEKNFLPGYILIEITPVGEVFHAIKNIPGVLGFLSHRDEKGKAMIPTPMRLNEINRILGKIDELIEAANDENVPFIVGETVKVIDGPFNNFTGVIEEINEEKKKLKVIVKIFGRKTPLELSYKQVEKE